MKRSWSSILALALIVLLSTSCLEQIKKPFGKSGKSGKKAGTTHDSSPANDEAALRRLQGENRMQRLRALEQDAVIARLDQQLETQRQTLDEVIVEVVRAKAKHATPQDRARAASESAEAEMALTGS